MVLLLGLVYHQRSKHILQEADSQLSELLIINASQVYRCRVAGMADMAYDHMWYGDTRWHGDRWQTADLTYVTDNMVTLLIIHKKLSQNYFLPTKNPPTAMFSYIWR